MLKKTARDIMTRTVITAKEDMVLTDVIKLLLRWHISGLPVADDDGMLVGILTEHDVLCTTLDGNIADTRVEEIMTKKVEYLSPDTLIMEIINRFARHQFRRVPVVENGKIIGIISRRDIVREAERIYMQPE